MSDKRIMYGVIAIWAQVHGIASSKLQNICNYAGNKTVRRIRINKLILLVTIYTKHHKSVALQGSNMNSVQNQPTEKYFCILNVFWY